MRFVADKSVEGPTVSALRVAGHTVRFIAEEKPGIDDSEVLSIARREQALLLTADKDFGELVFRNRESHFGVLLIRPVGDDPDKTLPTCWLSFSSTRKLWRCAFLFSQALPCGSEWRPKRASSKLATHKKDLDVARERFRMLQGSMRKPEMYASACSGVSAIASQTAKLRSRAELMEKIAERVKQHCWT